MKILLLGSGGREHAIAWKLAQSPRCSGLFIAPGNPGTAGCGRNVRLDPKDFESVGAFVLDNGISMVVPGGEEALVAGITDFFRDDEGLKAVAVIGPSRLGAMLEGSKAFAKEFMDRHGIPTAAYREFNAENREAGLDHILKGAVPVVLKADGLAAGKGVLIFGDRKEACLSFGAMLDGQFGPAGRKVVIEQFLTGLECSVFAITDGRHYLLLPSAKDYKRVGEGDTGPNTGGMGAVSPVPFANDDFMQKVVDRIVEPTVRGLKADGIEYRGVIYFGLMNVHGEPLVIEYNCRFGDPEAEAIIPLIRNDLVEIFEAMSEGHLDRISMNIDPGASATVILASGGYPGAYAKGLPVSGHEELPDVLLFHAGTSTGDSSGLLTAGGRVMAITSLAGTLEEALSKSLAAARAIRFEGKYFRSDIGRDLLPDA